MVSIVGSRIINPKGLNAVDGVFPQEIYDRFPTMLRTLSLIYALLATLGTLIVKVKKSNAITNNETTQSNVEAASGITLKESMQTKQFWLMWFMIITSATAGMNTVANYKQFAISVGDILILSISTETWIWKSVPMVSGHVYCRQYSAKTVKTSGTV